MRKMLMASVVLAAIALPAAADHGAADFTATGTILVGNPITRVIGGVTENVSPCGGSIDQDVPDGISNGVDAAWIELPEGSGGHAATLTADGDNDVDAWFYDAGCALIQPSADENAYSMSSVDLEPNGDEEGIIPAVAAWAAIDLYVGANATFTFTIQGVAQE